MTETNKPVATLKELYYYKAKVLSVYDADTVRVDIDLGLNTTVNNRSIRLYRINAPEMRGVEKPQGTIARDWLRSRILGKDIIIHTVKDKTGKYGRLLADIFIDEVCVNDELVSLGYAEYHDY